MHILLITSTYPTPARPRQGAFNRVLVDALRKEHRVQVIAPIPWPQWRAGVAKSQHRDTRHPLFFYPPRLWRTSYDLFYWRSILHCLKEMSEPSNRPDVVVGYWLHPDAAVAVRVAKWLGVPSVVMSGGSDLRLLTKQPRRRVAIRSVLEQADRIVVFSRDLAGQAQHLGIPREKIDVIYRGVDRNVFHPRDKLVARAKCNIPPNAIVVCWAGRLESVKNPVLLLKAARAWRRRWGDRFQALIIGEGSLQKRLKKLSTQLGLEGSIRYEGGLSHHALAQRFAAADVTVLTSHSEGTPNVLLESIACGTPFIATDVGGVADIATTGLDRVVPADDSAALAAALFSFIDARGCVDVSSKTPTEARHEHESVRNIHVPVRGFQPTDTTGLVRACEATFARALGSPSIAADAVSDLCLATPPFPAVAATNTALEAHYQ